MARIPQLAIWLGLLCGYLPYNMGYALFNPILLMVYAYLAILLAATLIPGEPGWRSIGVSAGLAQGTLLSAILVVNALSGVNEFVWPSLDILGAGVLVSVTGGMAVQGLNAWGARRGWHEDVRRGRLRMAFAALTLPVLFNSYLPYGAKMWIAEHTTNEDLLVLGLGSALAFVGIWRMTR